MCTCGGPRGSNGRHRLQADQKHHRSSESMFPTSPSQLVASTCKTRGLRLDITYQQHSQCLHGPRPATGHHTSDSKASTCTAHGPRLVTRHKTAQPVPAWPEAHDWSLDLRQLSQCLHGPRPATGLQTTYSSEWLQNGYRIIEWLQLSQYLHGPRPATGHQTTYSTTSTCMARGP